MKIIASIFGRKQNFNIVEGSMITHLHASSAVVTFRILVLVLGNIKKISNTSVPSETVSYVMYMQAFNLC